jgi:DNA-binding CsgD family transcriptional regulator
MLSFDPYQFAGRKSKPVHADVAADGEWESPGISFDDYRLMHSRNDSVPRRCKGWTPPFCMNPAQLQRVLLVRAWRVAGGRSTEVPAMLDWKIINQAATEQALKGNNIGPDAPAVQHEMQEKHKAAIRRAGGYMELISAIAFRAWRLGQNSTQVGESLGMTPWNVRAHLHRMRETALELGYDVGRQHSSRGVPRLNKREKELVEEAIQLTRTEQRARAAKLREDSLALLPERRIA